MDWFFVLFITVPIALIIVLPLLNRAQGLEKHFQDLRSKVVTKDGLNKFGRDFGVSNHGESLDNRLENVGGFYIVSPQDMGV